MVPAVWFGDIYLYASKDAGFVIGQNMGPVPDEETFNIAITFRPNQDTELQVVDTYDGETETFDVPAVVSYNFLAQLLYGLRDATIKHEKSKTTTCLPTGEVVQLSCVEEPIV